MNWETVIAVDFDKWAAEVYRANFPGVDVRCASVVDLNEQGVLPYADVYLGGPPCTPHSLAGKRKASKDARDCGPDFVTAVKFRRPRLFLMENVAGLMSSEDGRYAQRLLKSMEDAGYFVQIRILDSVSFGVPQFRVRCWWWGIRSDLYAAGMRHAFPKPTHAWPPPEPSMFGGELEAGITVGQALNLDGWLKKDTGDGFVERHGERRICGTEEPAQTLTADNTGGAGCRRSFIPRVMGGGAIPQLHIRRGERGSGFIERGGDRPAAPITEPSPTIANGENGSSRMYLQYDHGVAVPEEPSPTLKAGGNYDRDGKQGGGCPPLVLYRWSDAMLQKHPPASPAPTVQAKWLKGGAEGLLHWKQTPEGLWCRRLTALECMRLQSAPDDFRWPDGIGKTAMYRVAGNGWSSRMGAVFADAFHAVDPESRTVASLFCGGGLGCVGWHGRFWKYEPTELCAEAI